MDTLQKKIAKWLWRHILMKENITKPDIPYFLLETDGGSGEFSEVIIGYFPSLRCQFAIKEIIQEKFVESFDSEFYFWLYRFENKEKATEATLISKYQKTLKRNLLTLVRLGFDVHYFGVDAWNKYKNKIFEAKDLTFNATLGMKFVLDFYHWLEKQTMCPLGLLFEEFKNVNPQRYSIFPGCISHDLIFELLEYIDNRDEMFEYIFEKFKSERFSGTPTFFCYSIILTGLELVASIKGEEGIVKMLGMDKSDLDFLCEKYSIHFNKAPKIVSENWKKFKITAQENLTEVLI